MGCTPQSLLSQGRWLGEAETERSSQICSNLSVCFADSSPERGALDFRSPQEGNIYPDFIRTFY